MYEYLIFDETSKAAYAKHPRVRYVWPQARNPWLTLRNTDFGLRESDKDAHFPLLTFISLVEPEITPTAASHGRSTEATQQRKQKKHQRNRQKAKENRIATRNPLLTHVEDALSAREDQDRMDREDPDFSQYYRFPELNRDQQNLFAQQGFPVDARRVIRPKEVSERSDTVFVRQSQALTNQQTSRSKTVPKTHLAHDIEPEGAKAGVTVSYIDPSDSHRYEGTSAKSRSSTSFQKAASNFFEARAKEPVCPPKALPKVAPTLIADGRRHFGQTTGREYKPTAGIDFPAPIKGGHHKGKGKGKQQIDREHTGKYPYFAPPGYREPEEDEGWELSMDAVRHGVHLLDPQSSNPTASSSSSGLSPEEAARRQRWQEGNTDDVIPSVPRPPPPPSRRRPRSPPADHRSEHVMRRTTAATHLRQAASEHFEDEWRRTIEVDPNYREDGTLDTAVAENVSMAMFRVQWQEEQRSVYGEQSHPFPKYDQDQAHKAFPARGEDKGSKGKGKDKNLGSYHPDLRFGR